MLPYGFNLLSSFYHEWVLDLSNAFYLSVVMIIWVFSFSVLMLNDINICSNIETSLNSCDKTVLVLMYFFNTLISYLIFILEFLHLCSWVELTCNFFKKNRFKDLFSFSVSSWDGFSHIILRNYSFYLNNKICWPEFVHTILLYFNFLLEICHNIFLFQRTNLGLCWSSLLYLCFLFHYYYFLPVYFFQK